MEQVSENRRIQTSRLTQKGQTTISASIRRLLSLSAGDEIAYEVRDGTVVLRKAQPFDIAYAKALQTTLAPEWDSPDDHAAYDDL
jgi:AbrB family looped-hinge helix DNA binding protein